MHFMHGILQSLVDHSERPLFKQYVESAGSPSWTSISYHEFLSHLNSSAGYWQRHLGELGVQKSDVVGIWILGSQYIDLLHIYALIRAGYVPQIFHAGWVPVGSSVVNESLRACDGKALIYDPCLTENIQAITIPTCSIPDLNSTPDVPASELGDLPEAEDDDVAMIFHTSGTTSGRPKPVPQTHRWLFSQSKVNWPGAWQSEAKTQKCFNNLGSFGYVGTGTGGFIIVGQCIVQTSKPDFDANEFMALVHTQGLNNLLLFGVWLSNLLTVAKTNPDVLEALRSMQQISFTGEALNPEDARWVVEHNLPVTVTISLVSDLGDPENMLSLRLIEGMGCQLIPVPSNGIEDEGREGNRRVFDMFIPASADNCPHPTIRNRPNGHITGDLFEEVRPGYYIFRESIEDNIKLKCADLVSNCVVVGSGRPALVLFVESLSDRVEDPIHQKAEILKRTAAFNEKLYTHERIDSRSRVVIVSPGSLPRTKEKGNIRYALVLLKVPQLMTLGRRNEVEKMYANVLDEIYSQI
ncbi:hypothetical protein H0H87_008945 [Tephrocybe sp. NHM501043]|nr:hypothetical protein H0H87_008945 [Tephrocybe sp. NHM501043]